MWACKGAGLRLVSIYTRKKQERDCKVKLVQPIRISFLSKMSADLYYLQFMLTYAHGMTQLLCIII